MASGHQLSTTNIRKLAAKAEQYRNMAKRASEKGEHIVEQGVRTFVSSGVAFGCGLAHGRLGSKKFEIAGVPVDLGVGLAAHAWGFLGGGKLAPHLHAAGDGALASYATKAGLDAGLSWKKKDHGKLNEFIGAAEAEGSDD